MQALEVFRAPRLSMAQVLAAIQATTALEPTREIKALEGSPIMPTMATSRIRDIRTMDT
jgi:hypothetical protein